MANSNMLWLLAFVGVIYLVIALIWLLSKNKILNKSKLSLNQKETLKTKNLSIFLQITAIVLSSILTFIALFVSIGSLELQSLFGERQLQIMEDNYDSNWPNIEVGLRRPNIHLNYNINELKSMQFPKMELVLVNFGKVSTGNIYVESIYDDYIHSKIDYLLQISPQNGTNVVLELRQKNCTREVAGGDCTEDIGLRGIYNFTTTFYCEFCKEKYVNFTTPICIWENSTRECNYE